MQSQQQNSEGQDAPDHDASEIEVTKEMAASRKATRIEVAAKKRQKESRDVEPTQGRWLKWATIGNTVASLLIAAFTALLLWTNAKLWETAEKQAVATQDAVKAAVDANLPRVGVIRVETNPRRPEVGKDFEISLMLGNAGNGPAVQFRAWINRPKIKQADYRGAIPIPSNGGVSVGTLMPRVEFPLRRKMQITAEEIKRLAPGTEVIALTARTEYEDLAGNEHFTDISMFFNWEAGDFGFTQEGNDAK